MSRLWRHRDFLLLWTGQSVSDVGTAISVVVLPLVAVVYLDATPIEVGSLAALEWLPWLLIGLPAGVWVDRSFKRRLMLGCDVLRAVLLASVPIAAAADVLTIGQLLLVAFGTGLCTVVFQVAYQAYLPLIVERGDLPEANAKVQGSQSVAHVAGPGIGGVLAQLVRAPFALLADVLSYVVSAIALLGIRTPEPAPSATGKESVRTSIVEGARYVRRDALLRTMTLAPAVANLFYGGFGAISVVFLVREVGLESGGVGLLLAVTSLGAVLGALVARRFGRLVGTARAMWLSAAIGMPAGLLIPLAETGPRLVFFVVGQVLLFVSIVVYNVIVGAFRQAYCPPDLLGRVVATMRFVLFGTIPVGAFGGGVLATAIGIRDAAWILLIGNLLSAAVLILSPLRTMRDLPDSPPAPAGRPEPAPGAAHT